MPTVICSLDNPRGKAPRLSPAEAIGVINTLGRVYGWTITSALGCYRGQHEHALVIEGHGLHLGVPGYQLTVLADLLEQCGQETLLFIDARKHADLVWLETWNKDRLGVWVEADLAERDQLDAWTLVDAHLYTCR